MGNEPVSRHVRDQNAIVAGDRQLPEGKRLADGKVKLARQVTIGETTFKLDEPFLVLATQNPLEQEGTYPLPEAQVDRFIM